MTTGEKWMIGMGPLALPPLVPLLFLLFDGSDFEWVAMICWIGIVVATVVCAWMSFTIVGNWVRTHFRGRPKWLVTTASCLAVAATFSFYMIVGGIGCSVFSGPGTY